MKYLTARIPVHYIDILFIDTLIIEREAISEEPFDIQELYF